MEKLLVSDDNVDFLNDVESLLHDRSRAAAAAGLTPQGLRKIMNALHIQKH